MFLSVLHFNQKDIQKHSHKKSFYFKKIAENKTHNPCKELKTQPKKLVLILVNALKINSFFFVFLLKNAAKYENNKNLKEWKIKTQSLKIKPTFHHRIRP